MLEKETEVSDQKTPYTAPELEPVADVESITEGNGTSLPPVQ